MKISRTVHWRNWAAGFKKLTTGEKSQTGTGRKWTERIGRLMHQLATDLNFRCSGRGCKKNKSESKKEFWEIDFTWYAEQVWENLPDPRNPLSGLTLMPPQAAIEHENVTAWWKLCYCYWRLRHLNSGLRVLIGYPRDETPCPLGCAPDERHDPRACFARFLADRVSRSSSDHMIGQDLLVLGLADARSLAGAAYRYFELSNGSFKERDV